MCIGLLLLRAETGLRTGLTDRIQITISKNVKMDKPSVRPAALSALVPRSIEKLEITGCCLAKEISWAKELGPTIARYAALVDVVALVVSQASIYPQHNGEVNSGIANETL